MNDYNFGNFVCLLREKKGLTQADVAQQLGVTPAAVSKWENGSSKPRVEILFQLADILEVKPEELIAGHYIVEETLSADVVKQINERYNYLRKIDSYSTIKVKLLRILAWIIDWNIVGFFIALILTIYLLLLESKVTAVSSHDTLPIFLIMMLFPVLFVLRDIILRGRSIGKRITGLVVLDKSTGETAKLPKLFMKNLFLFIVHIDIIVLLISGVSIGDRVANTIVVLKKDLDNSKYIQSEPSIQNINSYSVPKSLTKKRVVVTVSIILLAIVLFIVAVFGIIAVALNTQKNTEEYKLAYNYIVDSSMFSELNTDEANIKLNSYNSVTNYDENNNAISTVEFGFSISGKRVYVICHLENNVWFVCPDCTKFN